MGINEMTIRAITHSDASKNILSFLDEDRLVQKTWGTEREGRHFACLLGAAGGFKSASECPSALMPGWLAHCTVALFDGLAKNDIVPISKRYGELIGKWSVIPAAGWDDILARWLVRLIDQAVDAVPAYVKTQSYWTAIAESTEQCKTAIAAKDKSAAGGASYAARAAAAYADRAAAYADRPRLHATGAATVAARAAAAYADRAAAYAAAHAYATGATVAARAVAYKALFTALLDEIEREIAKLA
jgi:hypothetical protein